MTTRYTSSSNLLMSSGRPPLEKVGESQIDQRLLRVTPRTKIQTRDFKVVVDWAKRYLKYTYAL